MYQNIFKFRIHSFVSISSRGLFLPPPLCVFILDACLHFLLCMVICCQLMSMTMITSQKILNAYHLRTPLILGVCHGCLVVVRLNKRKEKGKFCVCAYEQKQKIVGLPLYCLTSIYRDLVTLHRSWVFLTHREGKRCGGVYKQQNNF